MLSVWRITLVLLLSVWASGVVSADAVPSGQATEPADVAEAYYQFLLGRHFEGQAEVDRAIEAYRTAVRLDPSAADVLVDLAGLYARQGRPNQAIDVAREALQIDEDHGEAHRMLGLVLAAMANRAGQRGGPTGAESQRRYAADAIAHLERLDRDPQLQVTLARLYLTTDAREQAIALLTDVLVDEPNYREAQLLLARAYTASGQRTEAVATLERFIDDGPPFYRGLLTLAELYEEERRWSDAALAYERASRANPNSSAVRRRWANALASAGEVERATRMLREIISTQPSNAESRFLLATIERQAGNLEAAERAARQLVALDAGDLRGPMALLRVFQAGGDHQQAAATLDEAIALARASNRSSHQIASLLAELSGEYRALDNREDEVAALEEATGLAPADGRILGLLVQAYVDAGRLDDALTASAIAREERPDDLVLAQIHARALVQAGRDRAALDALEPLARGSGDPRGYAALAELYDSMEQFDEALGVLREGRETFPTNTILIFQLGAFFERQERYEDAERVFRDLIARDPAHAPALNYLGYVMADRGERLEKSVELIRRALAIEPDNAAFLDSLGWAYFKLDRLDLAEQPLRRASQMLGRNSVVQDHFGDLLERLGRYDDAIAAWERALAGDRDSIEPAVIERKIQSARQKVESR